MCKSFKLSNVKLQSHETPALQPARRIYIYCAVGRICYTILLSTFADCGQLEFCCLTSLQFWLRTDCMRRVTHHTCSHSVTHCTQAQNKDFVHSLSAIRNTYALTQEQQRTVRWTGTQEKDKMTRDGKLT